MKIWHYIRDKVAEHPLHFPLLDPSKQSVEKAVQIAKDIEAAGSDLILVGCSVGLGRVMDKYVKALKSEVSIPVVIFPNNLDSVSPYMDAMLLLSLINSENPYWITTLPAQMAAAAKSSSKESISTAYVIVEPGMLVGWLADAKPLPRYKPELAGFYALMAEQFGFKLLYLEAGSGADEPVPVEMVRAVKKLVQIPLIVGGGIRKPDQAANLVKAGADIIVTGNVIESSSNIQQTVRGMVDAIHPTKRESR